MLNRATRLLACVLGVSAFALLSPSQAQARARLQSECTPQTAERWEVTQLAQDSPLAIGRCVTISGYARGWHVFAGPEGMYRHDQAEVDRRLFTIRQGSPYVVGIERNDFPAPEPGPWVHKVTVTGRVSDCDSGGEAGWRSSFFEQMNDSDVIVLVNMGGYCHYNSGAVIRPVAIDYGGRRTFPRMIGDAAREEYGSIQPIPEDNPLANDLLTLGRAAHAAIRSGDRDALRALTGPDYSFWIDSFFEIERAHVEAIRGRGDAPQMAVFGIGLGEYPADLREDARETEGYACYCKEADCGGRWPISISDAQIDSRRPFVCILRIAGAEDDGTSYLHVYARISDQIGYHSPFVEPERSAPD